MNGSPSSVLSLGFGAWGSVGLVVTLGFGIGVQSATLVGLWSHVSPIDIHTEQPYIDAQTESRYIDQ